MKKTQVNAPYMYMYMYISFSTDNVHTKQIYIRSQNEMQGGEGGG